MSENQPAPDAEDRNALNVLGAVSIAIALFSIVIAGASAYLSYGPRVDAVRANIVEDLFESFEEWNALALEQPYLLHLIVPPERYDTVAGLVRQGTTQLNEHHRIELLLAEMAMADVLIAAYEEMLVDLDRAEASGDDFVLRETQVALEYFERRVMLNPRMLHFWKSLAGNRGEAVRKRHETHVMPLITRDSYLDVDGPIQQAQ